MSGRSGLVWSGRSGLVWSGLAILTENFGLKEKSSGLVWFRLADLVWFCLVDLVWFGLIWQFLLKILVLKRSHLV